MAQPRLRVLVHTTSFVLFAALVLGAAAFAPPAHACSCYHPSLRSSLESADFVADLRVLEVRPLEEAMFGGQYLLYRVERVYKAPATIAEGDEIWVYHQTCNSAGYDATHVGGRHIWFMGVRRGVPEHHFCSTSLDPYLPVPHLLLESRDRWLESRQ